VEERLIMKKMKRFKKAAVLLMAAVMCFGMAGCKKTTGGETPTGDVYAPSFSEISSDVEYVTNVLAGDGRLSIMGQVYDRETYALSQKLITLDIATSDDISEKEGAYTSPVGVSPPVVFLQPAMPKHITAAMSITAAFLNLFIFFIINLSSTLHFYNIIPAAAI
jgi:hypothetical protein